MRTTSEVREEGLKVLVDTLGLVDMVRFIQLYSGGEGDYAKEKYEQPDFSLEEVLEQSPSGRQILADARGRVYERGSHFTVN